MPLLAEAAAPTLDTSSVLELVRSMMGLFAEFPLNILLTASVAVIGFTIFRAAKDAAH